jgi:hypothetical protein
MKSNHLNIYHLISKARDGLDANGDPFTNHQLHNTTTLRIVTGIAVIVTIRFVAVWR